MKKGIKRGFVILSAFAVLWSSTVSFADYTTLYETASEAEYYADGVTHQTIQKLTASGWINLNVIRIDLTKNVEMTVVTDDYLSSRDALSDLVTQNNADGKIVAAINSDFFDTDHNTTMGNLLRDGEVLSTSIGYPDFATFNISSMGLPFVAYLNSTVNTVSNGSYTKKITYINKPYLSYDRTILYDANWAKTSYGNTLGVDILEILVEGGVIKEIRRSGEPFEIPEDGYVLSSVGTNIGEMASNFKVGDQMTLDYDVNFKYTNLSIGGGAQLVASGKVVENFTHNIAGNNPRTALGITKDRKQLILVTVDGRTNSYRGVTQTEMAQLLVELGAYEGINFDGGGSTEMVGVSPWTGSLSILNTPSDKVERNMYTGLAVKKVTSEDSTLMSVKITAKRTDLYVGSPVAVSLSAIDSNYDTIGVSNDQVTWSVEGLEGTFEGGYFTPSTSGKGTITASYQGLATTQAIEVHADAVKLNVVPGSIETALGVATPLYFSVQTADGDTVVISPALVSAEIDGSLGTFNGETGVFTAANASAKGYATFAFDGLVTYVPIAVGSGQKILYNFENDMAQFASYPVTVPGGVSLVANAGKSGSALKLDYDFTTEDVTRAAYITLTNPVSLAEGTQSIGLWVKGDGGNGHWLRGRLVGADGTVTNLTFARYVDWTGWKYVSAEIPDGVQAPFVLDRIYLAEIESSQKDSGSILIDEVDAVTPIASDISVPANVTRIKPESAYVLPESLITSNALIRVGYYDVLDQNIQTLIEKQQVKLTGVGVGYSASETAGMTVVKLNNAGGYIRTNGGGQWSDFLKLLDSNSGKPIVVVMSDVNSFYDAMEKDLFYEKLGEVVDSGTPVLVTFPTTNASFAVYTRNGVKVVMVPKSTSGLSYLSVGTSDGALYFESTP
jgi:hypothetical protein